MAPKVLIADDEAVVRALVRATLGGSSQYDLIEASDGQMALDLVRAEHPALVLLDIDMPELSGVEVCRQIKSDPGTRDVIVVMLTALSPEQVQFGSPEYGPDDYFVKPFSPLALLAKVEEVLGL